MAIGIDAAEPTLVRRLCDAGELPRLRALRDVGAWGRVSGPAHIGSGAVWPTFLTGQSPAAHGVHGEWGWQPGTMAVSRATWSHLTPFWGAMARRGHTVTVLDVPFAPLVGVPGCAEVLDWGAHDRLKGRLEVSPPALRPLVLETGGVHPFAGGEGDAGGPRDLDGLRRVAACCAAGARRRGDLALRLLGETRPDLFLMVFTEVHRASHLLWHTLDPASGLETDPGAAGLGRALPDLLWEVDRQVGRLVDAAGPDTAVLVFSLHGMRATRGIPAILDPLLRALGVSVVKPWRGRSWPERGRAALGAVKRGVPAPVKRLYYRGGGRVLGRAATTRLARPSMPVPAYDWTRTVAVSLPTDQHGWIRINLAGREARGIVDPRDYDQTCARLERLLRATTAEDGRPLVKDVLRTAAPGGPTPVGLPDLVVHWTDAATAEDLRLRSPGVSASVIGPKFTGQHALEGFFIWRSGTEGRPGPGDSVAAEDLHGFLEGQGPTG